MQPASRQLPNGSVYETKLDDNTSIMSFTVPQNPDAKLAPQHPVQPPLRYPLGAMNNPPFLYRAPTRSNQFHLNMGPRNVQIDAQQVIQGPNNHYTVVLEQQRPGHGQLFPSVAAQGHPAQVVPQYYLPYGLASNALYSAQAQMPGNWPAMGAPTGAMPMFTPQYVTGVPTQTLPPTSQAPPTSVPMMGMSAPMVNPAADQSNVQHHTLPKEKPPKKMLKFIDPTTQIDVMQELIEQKGNKDSTHSKNYPAPTPTGTVYYNPQTQQPTNATISTAPSLVPPPSAPSTQVNYAAKAAANAERLTTAPTPLHTAASVQQTPLTGAKSNASNDDTSGGTLTSRGATPTDISTTVVAGALPQQTAVPTAASRPKQSAQQNGTLVASTEPRAAPDEEKKNLIYNEFALNIAQAAGVEPSTSAASSSVPAADLSAGVATARPAKGATAASGKVTDAARPPGAARVPHPAAAPVGGELVFGFFDDSGLAGSSTPTPEPSPQKPTSRQYRNSVDRVNDASHRTIDASVEVTITSVNSHDATSGVAVVESLSSTTSTKIASCTFFSQGAGVAAAAAGVAPSNAQDVTLLPPASSALLIPPQLFLDLSSKKTPGAWFFNEQTGRRVYSRDYMLSASKIPVSMTSPNILTSLRKELLMEQGRTVADYYEMKSKVAHQCGAQHGDYADGSGAGGAGGMGFNVDWMKPGSGAVPPRRHYTNRNSTGGGGAGGGGGGRGSQTGPQQRRQGSVQQHQPPMIIPRPSLNAPEVQLKRTENAWKPIRKQEADKDPETIKTQSLYRDVKSVLNKITPQTFDELAGDFIAMDSQMDTKERIMGVIEILFNKVCDEPNFTCIYGQLCERFRQKQIEAQQNGHRKGDLRLFSYYLLIKCQEDFEKEKSTEAHREEKLQAIEAAETEEEKTRLRNNIDEDLAKFKWRTLGSMRFVGELYKRELLTKFLAYICINRLVDRSLGKSDKNECDEETLLCLCKFIETIGQKFDEDKTVAKDITKTIPSNHLDYLLTKLEKTMHEKKVPLRIQFEVQNLIELRKNKWIPRRAEAGPKTIEQVHSDAKMEAFTKKFELEQQQNMPRKQSQQQYNQQGGGGPNYYGSGSQQQQQQQRGNGQRMPQQRSSHSNLTSYSGQDYEDGSGTQTIGRNKKIPTGGRLSQDRSNRATNQSGGGGSGGGRQQPITSGGSSGPPYESRPLHADSLSRHTNVTENVNLAPPRRPWGISKTNAPAPTPTIANRYRSLADEETRHPGGTISGESAPGSRESSQHRAAPVADLPKDRQAALEASTKLASGMMTSSSSNSKPPSLAGPANSNAAMSMNKVCFETTSSGSSREASLTRRLSTPVDEPINMDELNKFGTCLIDEFVENNDFASASALFAEKRTHSMDLVRMMLEHVVEKHDKHRNQFAQLMAKLISNNKSLSKQDLVGAFEKYIVRCIDMELDTDVPLIWKYLGAIFGQIFAQATISIRKVTAAPNATPLRLSDFHCCFQAAGEAAGHKLLGHTMSTISAASPSGAKNLLADIFAGESWSEFNFDNVTRISDFLKEFHLTGVLSVTDALVASASSSSSSSSGENQQAHAQHQKHTRAAQHCDNANNVTSPDAANGGDDGSGSAAAKRRDTRSSNNSDIGNQTPQMAITLDPQVIEMERYINGIEAIDVDKLMTWIEENVKTVNDHHTEEFSRALTKSLCSKVYKFLDNPASFNEHFELYCRVFLRFITGQSALEQSLLTMLAHQYYENECPKDAFANMLDCLSSLSVVPRETFLEWWSTEKKFGQFGMITKNNQVKTFFETLRREHEESLSEQRKT